MSAVLGPEWNDTNPYYACYCIEHGAKTREEMQKKDDDRHPHGEARNGYFILWMNAKWSEWRKENGIGEWEPLSSKQRSEFGEWLQRKVGAHASSEGGRNT